MIPLKKYKKCITTKDDRKIEYVPFRDVKRILENLEEELLIEFHRNDYTDKGLENKFKQLLINYNYSKRRR